MLLALLRHKDSIIARGSWQGLGCLGRLPATAHDAEASRNGSLSCTPSLPRSLPRSLAPSLAPSLARSLPPSPPPPLSLSLSLSLCLSVYQSLSLSPPTVSSPVPSCAFSLVSVSVSPSVSLSLSLSLSLLVLLCLSLSLSIHLSLPTYSSIFLSPACACVCLSVCVSARLLSVRLWDHVLAQPAGIHSHAVSSLVQRSHRQILTHSNCGSALHAPNIATATAAISDLAPLSDGLLCPRRTPPARSSAQSRLAAQGSWRHDLAPALPHALRTPRRKGPCSIGDR